MDTMHKKINHLNGIQNLQYSGYIWMSDKTKPELFDNDIYDFSTIKINPFIIEANLFAVKEKISVSIKHLDGNYFILEIDLSNTEGSQLTEYKYLANNALQNIKKLIYKQYWIEENDSLCEGLPVLKPAWRAFVGFEKEEKND